MKISATLHIKCESCKKIVDVERDIPGYDNYGNRYELNLDNCIEIATHRGFHVLYERCSSATHTILLCNECYRGLYCSIRQRGDEME